MQKRVEFNNPFNGIAGLIILVLMVVGLFMLARFVFRILTFLSPVLLIAALILNYRVVLNYGKWILGLLRGGSPLLGVGAILLTIFGFPLVSAFLFFRALMTRGSKDQDKEKPAGLRGEYIEFEEVDEDFDQTLNLPELSPLPKEEPKKQLPREEEPKTRKRDGSGDEYDKLFE